ncbi:hypothetical protein J4E82_007686 [Alternaria postmessia]|uniref:uncharacterized protein n=1 Tax=Alternaria postmessia TaxID=1187938 RepID=UPI0022242B81|nr:uncharacterized protein J4E82_007686 [Alternaria postmessia]KAI5373638.1 hypothetical protein J4E82_007686 [Alternaria postmessia]
MPLWVFYHPPNTFTDPATKKALAKVLTDGYASVGLPRSYVVVLFQPIESDSYYIGGVARPSPDVPANKPGPDSTRPFIRIKIEHFARPDPSEKSKKRFLRWADATLKPFIADQGYDWEYSVEEADRSQWKINGIVPPLEGTEAEKEWAKTNMITPFESEKGGLLGKL